MTDRPPADFATTPDNMLFELQNNRIIGICPDSFWIIDDQGFFISVNAAACVLLGYSAQEIRGMHIADIDVHESPDDVQRRMRHILQHGSATFVTRHRRKDDSVVDVEVSAGTFLAPGGKRRFFAFVRDISDRLAIERTLRQNRDQLEQLVNARPRPSRKVKPVSGT